MQASRLAVPNSQAHAMPFPDFCNASTAVIVREQGGALMTVDPSELGRSGYVDIARLRLEMLSSFVDAGLSRAHAQASVNSLVTQLLATTIEGDVWRAPIQPTRFLVLVREAAAAEFALEEILRQIHAGYVADAIQMGLTVSPAVAREHGFELAKAA